jgi:hypothetical protein
VSTFFGDVTANGRINAADAAGVARIAALIDGGFSNTPLTDPALAGDVSGNGRLNAADASLVAQFAALISVPQIPAIPGGVSIASLVQIDEVTVVKQDDPPVEALSVEGNASENYRAIAVDTVLTGDREETTRDENQTLNLEDAINELFSDL